MRDSSVMDEKADITAYQPQTEIAPSSTDNTEALKAINRLRFLSPLKMRRIDLAMKKRQVLASQIKFMREGSKDVPVPISPDVIYTELEYSGTEGDIVEQVLNGFTQETPLTRGLWGKVTVALGRSVDEVSRTHMYSTLLHQSEGMEESPLKGAIDGVLQEFDVFDPNIRQRATDPDSFRTTTVAAGAALASDGLGDLFKQER